MVIDGFCFRGFLEIRPFPFSSYRKRQRPVPFEGSSVCAYPGYVTYLFFDFFAWYLACAKSLYLTLFTLKKKNRDWDWQKWVRRILLKVKEKWKMGGPKSEGLLCGPGALSSVLGFDFVFGVCPSLHKF